MRFLLAGGAESADHLHDERILGQPLAKGAEMLLGQDRRRHQDRHLPAVVDRLERGADGQLRLAIADVAADESIHRPRPVHVSFDLGHGGELIGRLFIGECRLELRLPFAVRRKGNARPGFTQGLQLDHLAGQVEDRCFDSCLLPLPAGAAEPGQLRIGFRAADVLLHQVDLGCGHINAHAALELQDQVFLAVSFPVEELHATIAGDAVTDMNHQVSLAQVEEAVNRSRFDAPPRQDLPGILPMKQLMIAEHDDSRRMPVLAVSSDHAKAAPDLAGHEPQPPRPGKLSVRQYLSQTLAFRLVVAGDEHAITSRGVVQLLTELGDIAAETFHRLDAKMARCFHRVARQSGQADAGKPQELLKGPLHRKQSANVGHPLQKMLALFLQVVRFDQDRPGLGGQEVAEMALGEW